MMFWLLIITLSLLAMLAVLYPLFANSVHAPNPLEEAQILYEARLSEVEKDLQLGRLDADNANAAKAELARNLIKLKNEVEPHSAISKPTSRISFILAAIITPLLAISIYAGLGTPPDISETPLSSQTPSIQSLLNAAEERLESNPDDVRGWKVVAPVYSRLGHYEKAIGAYRNILRLEEPTAQYTFGLGEALMSQENGKITPEALVLFKQTIDLQPDMAVADFYIGAYAMQQGDNEAAIAKWEAMLAKSDGTEDWLPNIKASIAELKSQMDSKQPAQRQRSPDELAMINGMVASLEGKLAQNPDDQEGWEMLIRSYMVLQRSEEAKLAISKARTQFAEDQSFMTKLEQIEKTLNQSNVPGAAND